MYGQPRRQAGELGGRAGRHAVERPLPQLEQVVVQPTRLLTTVGVLGRAVGGECRREVGLAGGEAQLGGDDIERLQPVGCPRRRQRQAFVELTESPQPGLVRAPEYAPSRRSAGDCATRSSRSFSRA